MVGLSHWTRNRTTLHATVLVFILAVGGCSGVSHQTHVPSLEVYYHSVLDDTGMYVKYDFAASGFQDSGVVGPFFSLVDYKWFSLLGAAVLVKNRLDPSLLTCARDDALAIQYLRVMGSKDKMVVGVSLDPSCGTEESWGNMGCRWLRNCLDVSSSNAARKMRCGLVQPHELLEAEPENLFWTVNVYAVFAPPCNDPDECDFEICSNESSGLCTGSFTADAPPPTPLVEAEFDCSDENDAQYCDHIVRILVHVVSAYYE